MTLLFVTLGTDNAAVIKTSSATTAHDDVAAAFFALRDAGHDIVFASGRNERSGDATVAWLDANGFWSVDSHLFMRKADDFRSDDIVKQEILDQIIIDYGKKPDMVFDDRKRVVDMWRDNGIFVFNVYQGEEDF